MPIDDALVNEAEQRGYLSFNQQRAAVTYNSARRRPAQDFTDPEEIVRAKCYSWLIIEKGYPANRIDIEHPIPRRVPGDYADIVVFADDQLSDPYLVVENKRRTVSDQEWRQAIEQGFGNANSLRNTRYLLVECDRESAVYDIHNFPPTERQRNFLGSREALSSSYGIARQFRLIAGATDDIRPVEPHTLEMRVRRAHALIWGGGKRDPLTAFDEWSKLLFAKIYDERHTPNGQPRQFQISTNETIPQSATRIRRRFAEACRGDPTIFGDRRIELPDDKIVEVVKIIQDIGFTLCDIDSLGAAFEHFFSSVFRGELGQYFTRRELVRFIVGMIKPNDTDFVLDPSAGSGGFLLDTLLYVYHYLDDNYAGQPETERKKVDFALGHLYGIEIHCVLSRVCKTNLLIHKDGHTNIEGERSCLDSTFSNPNIRPDGSLFSVVIGNPPFGDEVKEGDTDRLGEGSLLDFEISQDYDQISSELVILERSLQFLVQGGRLGMIVPDGLLNNSGENSRCPALRRLLLKNSKIEAIVSLPDYAFRKAGAQNKTSILFLRKHTTEEKEAFNNSIQQYIETNNVQTPMSTEAEKEAILFALAQNPYEVFLAEVEDIGYTPAGGLSTKNELYTLTERSRINYADEQTVIGLHEKFRSTGTFDITRKPAHCGIGIVDLLNSHPSFRLDPKFHLFRLEQVNTTPPNMTEYRLGFLLRRRSEEVHPDDYPDQEFLTLTLSQEGVLTEREAGKGNCPPSWHGAYFSDGSRWYRAHRGDVIISQIDLWKGCVSVIPQEFDQAIVTQEFPLYEVNTELLKPEYLALLLRSEYFKRAIRAITTGHSNRRRTQPEDFENLRVFLPEVDVQRRIVEKVEEKKKGIADATEEYRDLMQLVEAIILGTRDPTELIGQTTH